MSVAEKSDVVEPAAPEEPGRRPVRPVAVAIIVGALLVVAAVVIVGLTGRGATDTVSVDDQVQLGTDPAAVLDVEVIGVDPARGVQQVLVLPIPQTESGLFAAQTRLVVERDGLPPAIFTFAPGATIFPAQFEVAAVGGRTDYPWDRYASQLRMSLDEGSEAAVLPVDATLDSSLSGWQIDATLAGSTTGPGLTLSTEISRSTASIVIATLQFVAILVMSLLLAAVVVDNVQKRRATWMSIFTSLLVTVSLTSLRSLMPGSPPLGVKMDSAFTFPALIIVSMVVISFVVLYLWRWAAARTRGELPHEDMQFG